MSKVGAACHVGNAGRSVLRKWRKLLNTAGSWGAGTENMEKEEIRKGNDGSLKVENSLENYALRKGISRDRYQCQSKWLE